MEDDPDDEDETKNVKDDSDDEDETRDVKDQSDSNDDTRDVMDQSDSDDDTSGEYSTSYFMNNLVLPDGSNVEIPIRKDGMINLTVLSKALGRRIDNYMASSETISYIQALQQIPNLKNKSIFTAHKIHQLKHHI